MTPLSVLGLTNISSLTLSLFFLSLYLSLSLSLSLSFFFLSLFFLVSDLIVWSLTLKILSYLFYIDSEFWVVKRCGHTQPPARYSSNMVRVKNVLCMSGNFWLNWLYPYVTKSFIVIDKQEFWFINHSNIGKKHQFQPILRPYHYLRWRFPR